MHKINLIAQSARPEAPSRVYPYRTESPVTFVGISTWSSRDISLECVSSKPSCDWLLRLGVNEPTNQNSSSRHDWLVRLRVNEVGLRVKGSREMTGWLVYA